jgi:hypothetical protein
MEDSDSLSKKVAERINEVARIANQTREFVERGYAIIKSNLEKMDEIQATNSDTIAGIRSLGTQIESIWEVVNIINGIADQTKIIAFNAELEASAAGEAGRNFQIVATEVRRLAPHRGSTRNQARIETSALFDTSFCSEKAPTHREGGRFQQAQRGFDEIKNREKFRRSREIVSSGQQVSLSSSSSPSADLGRIAISPHTKATAAHLREWAVTKNIITGILLTNALQGHEKEKTMNFDIRQ